MLVVSSATSFSEARTQRENLPSQRTEDASPPSPTGTTTATKEKERKEKERVEEEVRKLEEELAEMKVGEDGRAVPNGKADNGVEDEHADELVFSKFCLRIYQVLTAVEVCPRRRLAPLRSLQPLLRSWRLKDRLSFLRRSWRGFRMLPTGPSLIRRRLTSLSSTQRRQGRGLSSS